MSNEELELKYERLLYSVRKMRGYQREYLRWKINRDMHNAKHWEREVDNLLKKHEEEKASGQLKLL